MDRDGATVWLREVIITHLHELLHDVVRRGRSVYEKEVVMSNPFISEKSFVVLFFIQSDNPLDIKFFEDFDILIGVVSISLVSIPLLDRAHECHELAWDNPVKIAIFDSLVEFVLLDVEGFKIVPSELDGVLEALKALEESTFVKAVTLGGISIGLK